MEGAKLSEHSRQEVDGGGCETADGKRLLTPGRLRNCPTMYFAHAGHWLTGIAYFVPVVAFLVWLGVTQIKDRRDRGKG